MKISQFIAHLEKMKNDHGDLPVGTYDGMILRVKGTPCRDGICREISGVIPEPNEIVLEFATV